MNSLLAKSLRRLSMLLFAAALGGIGVLLFSDAAHGLQPTRLHGCVGALVLMLAGSSYVSFQLAANRLRSELFQAILLGGAFFLWGCEQILPPSPWTTVMDTAVIVIFVADLGLVVLQQVRRPASAC